VGRSFREAWTVYMRRIRWARSGQVEAVLVESEVRQVELGGPVADGPETSPRPVMAEALSELGQH
jgi:hypothetical protein